MVGTQGSQRVIHAAPGSLERKQVEERLAEEEKSDLPPSTEELREMISVAAYFRGQERHFEPGHELEDWLAAESEIYERYGLAARSLA
jgi:hypothetical protein